MELPCIKCKAMYSSDDVEPYYCPSCNDARKAIARELDAKRANLPRAEVKPRFSPQDFKGKNGRIFFNANELV